MPSNEELGAVDIDMSTVSQPVGHRFTPAALMVQGQPISSVVVEVDVVPTDGDRSKMVTIKMMWRCEDLLNFVNIALTAIEDADKNYEAVLAQAEALRREQEAQDD